MDENRKNLYQDEGRETRREIQCHMSNKTEGTQGYTHVWMATEPSSDRSRRWVLVCMDLHTLLTLTRTPQSKQLWAVPVLPVRCPEKRWGSGVFSAGLPGCRCPPQAHSHWTGWRGGRRSSWSRAGLGGGSGPLCAHSSPPDATYLQRRGSSFDLISFQFHQCCEQKEITWVEPAVGRIQMEPNDHKSLVQSVLIEQISSLCPPGWGQRYYTSNSWINTTVLSSWTSVTLEFAQRLQEDCRFWEKRMFRCFLTHEASGVPLLL